MSQFVSPAGARVVGAPGVELAGRVQIAERGGPEEIWVIEGLEAVISLEAEGSSEGFIRAADWEARRSFRSRSIAELRAQLFAWVAEIQDGGPSACVPKREIFVFGSNLRGAHGKGAALHAARHYGAVRGVGEGLTGDAYAIPTKDRYLRPLPIADVEGAIQRFCTFARTMPEARFLVTPVGTGLAGIPKPAIWRAFVRAAMPANCTLTSSWME